MLAMASLEVDMSGIEEGQTVTVKWRGKPVFIRHRTDAEIAEANGTDLSELRDAQTDAERVVDPKVRVVCVFWGWFLKGCCLSCFDADAHHQLKPTNTNKNKQKML